MSQFRLLITFAVLLLTLHVARGQINRLLEDPTLWPPDDYVEYWAAGRLNLYGENPYSKELLLPLERDAGRDIDEAVMMWNPPWTLTIAMPLGAMRPREGQLAWLLLNFAAIAISAYLIWEIYCGLASRRWIALAISFTFVPTLFVLQSGQMSALVLLGSVLFIWAMKNQYEYAAGAAACLIAVKPHLAYLLWFALVADLCITKRWRIIAGGIMCGSIMSIIPTIFNPSVWEHYINAYQIYPPVEHVSLTIGVALRMMLNENAFWMQFLPMIAGSLWLVWYIRRNKNSWNWYEQMPWIVLVSFVTAPYGAWHFDLVILLLPILHRAAKLSIRTLTLRHSLAFTALIAINIAMYVLLANNVWTYMYAWVAPSLLLLYIASMPRGVAYTNPTEIITSIPTAHA